MNISICITTYNEEKNISSLIDSLLKQTLKPKEIIIVDGGSSDSTLAIIQKYSNKNKFIKFIKAKCSRSEGRNIGIKLAKNEIIAVTDAGCVANKSWLREITHPFTTGVIDISAGFYKMKGRNPVQNAMSVFLGVQPQDFGLNFLPSTRSIAFTKNAWIKVGGFPESRENSAEDTDFNYKAVKIGLNYARVKTAVVEWGMPENFKDFFYKIKEYARWDALHNIWWHPIQRFTSHNIRALSIVLRHVVFLILLLLTFYNRSFSPLFFITFLGYLFYAYCKIYYKLKSAEAAIYGPLLQIVCDFAVIAGFIRGILETKWQA